MTILIRHIELDRHQDCNFTRNVLININQNSFGNCSTKRFVPSNKNENRKEKKNRGKRKNAYCFWRQDRQWLWRVIRQRPPDSSVDARCDRAARSTCLCLNGLDPGPGAPWTTRLNPWRDTAPADVALPPI